MIFRSSNGCLSWSHVEDVKFYFDFSQREFVQLWFFKMQEESIKILIWSSHKTEITLAGKHLILLAVLFLIMFCFFTSNSVPTLIYFVFIFIWFHFIFTLSWCLILHILFECWYFYCLFFFLAASIEMNILWDRNYPPRLPTPRITAYMNHWESLASRSVRREEKV